MAEFSEIVKQLGRICALNFGECDMCDIRPFCPSKTFLDKYAKSGRAERLEEMVMKLASERPEPVYETWYEFLRDSKIMPDVLEDFGDFYKSVGKWLVRTRIKHDIAQKLGIEPREVNRGT